MIYRNLTLLILIAAVVLSAACEQGMVNNTTSNTNTVNMNSDNMNVPNANVNSSEANSLNDMSSEIQANEPEKYQANITLKLETAGANILKFPPIQAKVARNGADRRMEFALPNGQKLVYLDIGGKQLVISPARKEYAELNRESTGFDVRSLMLPEQIVKNVKNVQGVEKVGEEKVNGRDVIKYRYGASAQTNTKAGEVDTESYILVDKKTNLPLRSETNAMAQGQNVQGVKGAKIVTEMSDIKTDIDSSLFAAPTDYKKVAPEQIKSQIDMMFNIASGVIQQVMKGVQTSNAPANNN